MGRFRYGTPPLDYEFDDRTLTHLRRPHRKNAAK